MEAEEWEGEERGAGVKDEGVRIMLKGVVDAERRIVLGIRAEGRYCSV